jgi:ParB/RepB/Spo0J family partition protein
VAQVTKKPANQLTFVPTSDLNPDPSNPRKHNRVQILAIARSIEAFGFNAPILINKNKQIIAGHGRYEAAKLSGCAQVPVICLEHLTEAQARAYMLADNKLTDRSSWDETAIVNGRKPPQLTAQTLMRLTPRLPAGWAEQRKLLGFR